MIHLKQLQIFFWLCHYSALCVEMKMNLIHLGIRQYHDIMQNQLSVLNTFQMDCTPLTNICMFHILQNYKTGIPFNPVCGDKPFSEVQHNTHNTKNTAVSVMNHPKQDNVQQWNYSSEIIKMSHRRIINKDLHNESLLFNLKTS